MTNFAFVMGKLKLSNRHRSLGIWMLMASCGDSGDVTVNTTDGGSPCEASGSGKKPVTIVSNPVEMMKTEKSFSSGTEVQFGN